MTLDDQIQDVIERYSQREIVLGWLRYEALRKLNVCDYAALFQRNLAGENFDQMVTDLVIEYAELKKRGSNV